MPTRAPSACNTSGCRGIARSGRYCDRCKHAAQQRREQTKSISNKRYNSRRADSDRFYGSQTWKRFRANHLRQNPLCVDCRNQGRLSQAVVVDHIEPFKLNPDRALDPNNMRSLCRACDNRRRSREITQKRLTNSPLGG